MSEGIQSRSINSLSPVFPSRFDVADALEVLNASIDSVVARKLLDESSPRNCNSDDPVYVIEKCRAVIDDLQFELDAERSRATELESTVERWRADLDSERKKLKEERLQVEELRREKHQRLGESGSVARELADANRRLAEKDLELENMTHYCEKRISEMKRAMKESSSTLSTPPLPQAYESIKDAENKISNLTQQLNQNANIIKMKDQELQSVVESYEKQVRMLKSQLKSSEELLARLSRGIATPSPRLDSAPAQAKSFVDSEFTRLNKTNLSYRSGPNPFSSLN